MKFCQVEGCHNQLLGTDYMVVLLDGPIPSVAVCRPCWAEIKKGKIEEKKTGTWAKKGDNWFWLEKESNCGT